MAKPRRGSREIVSAKVEGVELLSQREDGQFEYEAIAQFWDIVNDRLMVFRRGSFARTISHWATAPPPVNGKPNRPVKINDAHVHMSKTTVGTVEDARETDVGVWYRGVLSSTEGDLHTKLAEGHVEQNSVEIFVLVEDATRVPLEDVPIGAFIWEESKGDGSVGAREILEVAWVGIALLPASSQDMPAIVGLGQAMAHQGLPVAGRSTAWDATGAKARLDEWAGTVQGRNREPVPAWASLAAAHLARGPVLDDRETFLGQIADVIDGRLVVVPEALDMAVEELAASGLPVADRQAALGSVRRYRAAVRRSPEKDPCAAPPPVVDCSTDAGSLPGPASETESPPTTETATAGPEARSQELRQREINLLSARLRHVRTRLPEAPHVADHAGEEPVRPGGQGLRGASSGS